MENLDNLLNLFSGESEVQQMLKYWFDYAFRVNEEMAISYLQFLIDLKMSHPNFSIIFSEKRSCFNGDKEEIVISNFNNNPIGFFHELTHAIHFYKSFFSFPKDFSSLKKALFSSPSFMDNCIQLLNSFKERRLVMKCETDDDICDYNCLIAMEDIIDALVNGRSMDNGLFYDSNVNYIPKRSDKASGHGASYYVDDTSCFKEIIACFSSLKFSKNRDLYFGLLCNTIGQDMFDLIDNYSSSLSSFKKESDFEMK